MLGTSARVGCPICAEQVEITLETKTTEEGDHILLRIVPDLSKIREHVIESHLGEARPPV